MTLLQALACVGFGTHFAGMVQPDWPVPPCWAQGRFPKVQEPSESGTAAALCSLLASLLPASVSPARVIEQDGSPHWVLRGHRESLFRAQGSHTHQILMGTVMPHARCLWPWGSPTLGSFLGTGISQRLNTSLAHSSSVQGTDRHRDPPCWALYGLRDLSCQMLYGHKSPLMLGTRSPYCGCSKDAGISPTSTLAL